MADDRTRLNQRLRPSDPDKDDQDGYDCNRRGRVHRNAQLAMVGIRVERMDVRHLDHGEQRQQGQTQQRRCPESVWLPAAAPTIIWLQSGQQIHPLLIEYIGLDAPGGLWVPVFAGFLVPLAPPTLARAV